MTVRVYKSTDAGAPVLDGQAGSLVNLLDKCLVQGYGSKLPLGWEIAFTGASKRAYRSTDVDATGVYLQVLDDASVVPALQAVVRGYLSMTDVNTGTGPFPETAPYYWKKSSSAGVARAWVLWGDERFFGYATQLNGSSWSIQLFGDVISFASSDPTGAIISASVTNNATSANSLDASQNNQASSGNSWAQGLDGTTPAPLMGFRCVGSDSGSIGSTGTTHTYPNPVDNTVGVAPIYTGEALVVGASLRGQLPGIYQPLHNHGFANLTEIPGLGPLTGRTLMVVINSAAAATSGNILVDITGPWR